MRKTPAPWVAIIPLTILIALLSITIYIYGSDSLYGGSQLCLLIASAISVMIGMKFYGISWKEYEEAISTNVKNVTQALLIILIIGALSSMWMISGVVPTMIYYGMKILHPDFFLASTCLITILVSVTTGSSWATIATIGLALIGIGISHGFSEGWVAGAIISGAYFGDKISPLSDTTVLASSMVNVPIMKHIRYMLITTIPAMVIALIVFTIAGLSHSSMGESQVEMFTSALDSRFNISLWLLIVPVVTGIMIARRMSSIITLFLSAALSGVFAVIFQADILREIAQHTEGAWQIVEGIMTTYFASTSLESTSPLLEELISTRGMGGMLSTLWLIICAMCFGGSMTASGLLGSLMSVFARKVKSTFGLVSSTVASGLTLNLITADQYISIILTGQVFRSTYRETGHEDRLLSRSTEDAATVTSALIPWNSCGMTHSTILGVPTLTYLPYCFFNILSPIMSLVIAYIGHKIYKPSKKSVTTPIEKTA